MFLSPKVRFYHRTLNLKRALLRIIFYEQPMYANLLSISHDWVQRTKKIFLIHLTIQFIDLEMLYISVKQGINFGTFPIFWIRIKCVSSIFTKAVSRLKKLESLKIRIPNHRISAILWSNTTPNFRFTRKMNLQREPCMQISGNWHVPDT